MTSSRLRAIGDFLRRTPTGRMILFAALLAALCLLAPGLLKKKTLAGPDAGSSGSPPDPELPPSPLGIGDTLTLGQKYDALISRYGGDLSSTRSDVDVTRKELEMLRSTLKEERAAQEKDRKELGDTLQQLKEGLVREALQAPAREAQATPAGAAPHPERTGLPLPPGGLRILDLGAPGQGEKKRAPRMIRIPAGAGARAKLLNGIFAPISGEPSPVRLKLEAAILGPNHGRIPLQGAVLIGKAIGERRTSRGAAQASRRRLSGMGVRVLGAALNAVEGPETAYGYYGYYYSYYKTKDEKKKA